MEYKQKIDLESPQPGIYTEISFEDYVQINAVNNSLLKIMVDQSPAHAKWYAENGRPETQALAFGSAADCYILEPSLFAKKYVMMPKDEDGKEYHKNTKVYKEFAKNQRPEVEGILKQSELEDIISISNCMEGSEAMALLRGGVSQLVLIWVDEPTGLTCKARLDYWNEQLHCITDLKTTRNAKPEEFAKDIFKFKYYQQAAFYLDGFCSATGEEIAPSFVFFATEKVEPYVHNALELGELSLTAGRASYRSALDRYAKCLKDDKWPMYREEVTMIEMPDWALAKVGVGSHEIR
jgi:exodeoxyribonuclease VIII